PPRGAPRNNIGFEMTCNSLARFFAFLGLNLVALYVPGLLWAPFAPRPAGSGPPSRGGAGARRSRCARSMSSTRPLRGERLAGGDVAVRRGEGQAGRPAEPRLGAGRGGE